MRYRMQAAIRHAALSFDPCFIKRVCKSHVTVTNCVLCILVRNNQNSNP